MPTNTTNLINNKQLPKPQDLINYALVCSEAHLYPQNHPYNFSYMCDEHFALFLEYLWLSFESLEVLPDDLWLDKLSNLIVEVQNNR